MFLFERSNLRVKVTLKKLSRQDLQCYYFFIRITKWIQALKVLMIWLIFLLHSGHLSGFSPAQFPQKTRCPQGSARWSASISLHFLHFLSCSSFSIFNFVSSVASVRSFWRFLRWEYRYDNEKVWIFNYVFYLKKGWELPY